LNPLQEIELAGAGPIGFSPGKDLLYVTASMPLQRPRSGSQKTEAKRRDGAEPASKASGIKGRGTPALATFRIGKDGKLQKLQLAAVNLAPGYLKTDAAGGYLAGNHYGPGKITVWKLDGDGIYQGETVQEFELEPKAHSTVFSPDSRFVLVPATGPNKVFQLKFDGKSGRVEANDPPHANGPQGEEEARQPRHLIFHPNGKTVYTTLERERPGVGVWTWNAKKGSLKVVQNIVTQPEGRDELAITTADLHLTPNSKFLYVSNRDTTDRKARSGVNSIVGFRVDAKTGRLEMIGHTACEHVPRSFAVDATGKFVYVAGQGDDRLGVYRIDPDSGVLTKVTQYEVGAGPRWVECLAR
jgi:6-phosphogluconolactonase